MPAQERSRPWPPFLAPMRGLFESLRPPRGPFHPAGAWEHRYIVCSLQPERRANGENPRSYGRLVLARKPAAGNQFSLDVDFSITTRASSGSRTHASLTCAADRLATPGRWELRSEAFADGKPAPLTGVTETAVFEAGALIRRGPVERKRAMPRPFTSNWSLMEAVQRLPFDDFPPLHFDMLEDLDLRKPEQTLRRAGDVSLELAGEQVRLHAFRHIGRGILPIHYWVDDQHRLLAVTGSLRGFLWDGRKEMA